MRGPIRIAGLAAAAVLGVGSPALAQGFDDLEGAYRMKVDSVQGADCPPGPPHVVVANVTDRALDLQIDGAGGQVAFFASGLTFAGQIPISSGQGQVSGSFTRGAGKVDLSLTLRYPPGMTCAAQWSGSKGGPAAPNAALPGAGELPGTDPPPPSAAAAPEGLVLFGLDETKILLIGAGVLFVIGLLYGLLGGRRPRRDEPEPEPFVQSPPREAPAPVVPPASPPPPPTPPTPAPEAAAPPIGEAPEPEPELAPEPEPEPVPEPVLEPEEAAAEPVIEPPPAPEPEPAVEPEPEAPVAGAGHAPPPRPVRAGKKTGPKPAAKPATAAKPPPRPRPKKPKT